MADGKNFTKSGGRVAALGALFLVPNDLNQDNPLLPLDADETPPPPDAWDHFQGDEIALVAIPNTTQANDVKHPVEDAWDWYVDALDYSWIAIVDDGDDAVNDSTPSASTVLTVEDAWNHWEPDPDVTVIESGSQNVDVDTPPADAWDFYFGEEIELAYIPGSFQRESTDPIPEDPWYWDDPYDDDWQLIVDDDDDAVGPDAPVVAQPSEDAWYWDDDSSELEDFGTEPLGANVDRPPDEIEWPWVDGHELDEDWAALATSDSAPVGANVAPVPEDPPWDWSEAVEEDAAIDLDQPIGANVDPVQEDPWYWDDGFDDEAAVDLDQPIGANVAPSPEDPWDWSEFPDDDAVYTYDSAPVGANVDPVPEDPIWDWSEYVEEDAAIDFDQPIGANVDPIQEDAWDWWNEYPTEDDQLDFDAPQPIDFVAPSFPVEDPWDWYEYPDDDAAIDFDQPLGANVDPIQEDPWLWDDSFDDEAAVDLDQPLGANVAPVPEDPWDWSEFPDDDQTYTYDSAPVGANVDPVPEDPWTWDDSFDDSGDTDYAQPLGANVDPIPEDPWDWSEYPDDDGAIDFNQSQSVDAPSTSSPPEDAWDHFSEEIELTAFQGTAQAQDIDALSDSSDPWTWDDTLEDDWDSGSDALTSVLDTNNFQHDWQWEEAEDDWHVLIDDDDDAVGANAPVAAVIAVEDPWDWFSEEIETLAGSGSYIQTDGEQPGTPEVGPPDPWDHFAEEIALVAIQGTYLQTPPLPPSTGLANSDENFHFYIGDVEHFHAEHFDNYDSDNAPHQHEWYWEWVEDETYYFGTDAVRANAILLAPAPDEPWPHWDNPLGDEELIELGSSPVGRDLEPCPADPWEWTVDEGDETTALTVLDQPQPPPDPSAPDDPWPHWDDTGEETGDFETTASVFDISVSPIAIDDPWRWFDDEVDESPIFAVLDAIDNTPIPPSGPPEDPPWDWSEAVEDFELDLQHALIDIVPDVPSIGDESGPFDWPAEDSFGDEPTLFGNAPVGPDGCPACVNTAKRWFGPTFVKFLQ